MLTLQFIPYTEIENLSSHSRIKKVLEVVKDENIVLLQGRLRKNEETELIQKTMEAIGDNSENAFKGIELSVIEPSIKNANFMNQLRYKFINMLLGDRQGFTIVGPASIVKEIKQDPDKLQLFIDNITKTETKKSNGSSKKKSKKIKKKN
jgi:hypothetical protein